MTTNSRKSFSKVTGALLAILLLAAPALAGPPLICHTIDIGSAQSLPWSANGWNLSGSETYDVNHLVSDALALLNPQTTVLVRMETMRRATLYAQSHPQIAKELLLRVKARTTENDRDALAAFDFGYLIECYRQAGIAAKYGMLHNSLQQLVASVDGYDWVKKAIAMRGEDASMEFAATLITSEVAQQDRAAHLQKAEAGAKSDPLLAANLESRFGNETLAQHLAPKVAKN
jgi:hypothetical protein